MEYTHQLINWELIIKNRDRGLLFDRGRNIFMRLEKSDHGPSDLSVGDCGVDRVFYVHGDLYVRRR